MSIYIRRRQKPMSGEEASRNLRRATLGVRDTELSSATGLTLNAWLDQQLAMPYLPEYVTFRTVGSWSPIDFPTTTLSEFPVVWINQIVKIRYQHPDVLRNRMTYALLEYFSVGPSDGDTSNGRQASWYDIIQRNCFGTFRQLIEDVTRSSVMGEWLTYKGNLPENLATGRKPDENYAREIMQLYTIGLWELNLNGTRIKKGELPVNDSRYVANSTEDAPTYLQEDILNMARVFTGLECRTAGNLSVVTNTPANAADAEGNLGYSAKMDYVIAANHESTLPKYALRGAIDLPIGTSGNASLAATLDALTNYPSTAPYFCKRMIQLTVSSNPSPEYIARVSSVFRNNGSGVVGHLPSVWKAIFLDQEAQAPVSKQLTTRVVSADEQGMALYRLRQYNLTAEGAPLATGSGISYPGSTVIDGAPQVSLVGDLILKRGRNPSVFGRWPAQYAAKGEIYDSGLVSPELYTYDEASAASYRAVGANNYKEALNNQVTANDLNLAKNNPTALIDQLILQLTSNTYPSTLRANLIAAYPVNSGLTDTAASNRYGDIAWEISVSPYAVART